MSQSPRHSPQAIMQKHGKSFYLASLFLGKKTAKRVAKLYQFCRAVDDLADIHPNTALVGKKLQAWQSQIHQGQATEPAVKDILCLARECSIDTIYLAFLIEGVRSDLSVKCISDENQLIQYAYLVAGTVGLMMCSVLGATHPNAKKFAVDLGIAMQLTNILRDVAEDAAVGRQYIPQSWLEAIGVSNLSLETTDLAKPAYKRLFELAENYYKSGYAGLHYLPIRSRLAISIAGALYQEIAKEAKRRDFNVWQQRIVISNKRKCWLVIRCLLIWIRDLSLQKRLSQHNAKLHHALGKWQG